LLQKLGSREKILLGVLAAVLVLFAFYKFLAQPQAARYSELKKQLKDTREQVLAVRQNVAMLKTEKDGLRSARTRYEEAAASFAGNLQDGGAVINLGLSSAACGVKIAAFKPGIIAGRTDYLELPAEMEARGQYAGVLTFLEGLENSKIVPNLVKINSLHFEPAEAKGKTPPAASGASPPGGAGEAETDVMLKMSLVFYSAATPEGRLALEQVAGWKVGRENVFRPAEMVSPYQGVKPQGAIPQEAVLPGGAGEPGTAPEQATGAKPQTTPETSPQTAPEAEAGLTS